MTRRFIWFPALLFIGVSAAHAQGPASEISASDTAWLLTSTALVMLMTPALAFFYGGLVRAKHTLNTMMMSFVSLGVAGMLWALLGYSLAFGTGGAWLGDGSMALLRGVGLEAEGSIPHLLFMAFQGTFAVITVALISGAVVERMRFPAYMLFIGLWVLFVYAPVCHWVWGGGWLAGLGALDFAGGAVVHVNAGAAAVTAALFLGPRRDYGRRALLPHHVPFVLLGAGLLWFGWFGFNGGSALAADATAGLAFVNTMLAPAATLVVWTMLDHFRTGKITAVGVATSIVVGLVAVTPAAGFVSPLSSMALGALAALPSYFAIRWRTRTRLDDALDVFAAHGLGGITGALLTGVFADAVRIGSTDGPLPALATRFGIQALSVLAVFVYSGLLTFALLKTMSLVMAVRADDHAERLGLDVVHHGEEAYSSGEGALLLLDEEARPAPAPVGAAPAPAWSARPRAL